ncbi:YkgJ family cysteine cluster protein [Frisingicoccus sp.]
MKRNVRMEDISDGRLYDSNDMVKAGCMGCGSCCRGMGQSIILDPLDLQRIKKHLGIGFEGLMTDKIELNVVDGVILPNLRMAGPREQCSFLDEENRCRIHSARPGICRLFPLGRYYENQGFRYFLQVHECKNENPMKVKVKKWVDEEALKKYEAYIKRWHYFLKAVEETLETADDGLQRRVNLYILQKFYIEDFSSDRDFYEQFEERIQTAVTELKR